MRQRSILIFALVVAAVLALTTPALAGPVIVALDRSPIDVQAGVPFTVGFTVISHGPSEGLEPIAGLTPHVIATDSAGQRVDVTAQPEGVPGHYVASLTLPAVGEWQWFIDPFGDTGPQARMTPLQVRAAGAPVAWYGVRFVEPLTLRWAGTTLLIIAAALALASQRTTLRRWGPRQAH
jgi:hypothetical protein